MTNTITRDIQVFNDPKHATTWLASEYPSGVNLVYIDYGDNFEDAKQLQNVLHDVYYDLETHESEWHAIDDIISQYRKENDNAEISDDVKDAIQEWCYEHDTSNPVRDLLNNTGSKLFYIETRDFAAQNEERNTGCNKKDYARLVKKYGKNDAQSKAICYVLDNQFYGAPVSFYFYASVLDVYNALHGASSSEYIQVDGAYFSTVDRVQGSNWMGEDAIFTLTIPRADFLENVYLDAAKGNGYGWGTIAGQSSYDDAGIITTNTKRKGSILVESETSERARREAHLQAHWDKTKTCTSGDMNPSRHAHTHYENNVPCGTHCDACGTFWID